MGFIGGERAGKFWHIPCFQASCPHSNHHRCTENAPKWNTDVTEFHQLEYFTEVFSDPFVCTGMYFRCCLWFVKVHTENSESLSSRKDQVLLGISSPNFAPTSFKPSKEARPVYLPWPMNMWCHYSILISQSIIDSDFACHCQAEHVNHEYNQIVDRTYDSEFHSFQQSIKAFFARSALKFKSFIAYYVSIRVDESVVSDLRWSSIITDNNLIAQGDKEINWSASEHRQINSESLFLTLAGICLNQGFPLTCVFLYRIIPPASLSNIYFYLWEI